MRPQIDGEWWQVASNPDLGEFTTEKQEPVDFSIWQARDGTWPIWSCIRYTDCGGHTRLLYGWEGAKITQPHWEPKGIAMEGQVELGEEKGFGTLGLTLSIIIILAVYLGKRVVKNNIDVYSPLKQG